MRNRYNQPNIYLKVEWMCRRYLIKSDLNKINKDSNKNLNRISYEFIYTIIFFMYFNLILCILYNFMFFINFSYILNKLFDI